MEEKTKEKLIITAIMFGFFSEAAFGGLKIFDKIFSVSVVTSDQLVVTAVKGIATSTYDDFANYSFILFVLAANLIAISLIIKFGLKNNKTKSR